MTTEKPVFVERRKGFHTPEDCINMGTVKSQFDAGSERMMRIEDSLTRLSEHQIESDKARVRMESKLDTNTEITGQLLEIIQAGKGFFRTLGWLTDAAKWVAALAVPIVGLWYAIKEGVHK